jgi:hypothetical protein
MLVFDKNIYPKDWVSTNTTADNEGVLTEKKFYNEHRDKQTSDNWVFKWIYTQIGDTEEYDIDVVVNN